MIRIIESEGGLDPSRGSGGSLRASDMIRADTSSSRSGCIGAILRPRSFGFSAERSRTIDLAFPRCIVPRRFGSKLAKNTRQAIDQVSCDEADFAFVFAGQVAGQAVDVDAE